jgi:hypothetical protein
MRQCIRYPFFFALLFLLACDHTKVAKDEDIASRREQKYKDLGTLFGDDAFTFGEESKTQKGQEIGIGVNSFLWRAALDTISFMPLKNADPFGGVILTDWYTSAETPYERIKVDILILSRQLRADGLKISVFQQKLTQGQWVDQPTDPKTIQELEHLILTRARQLKVKNLK